jgi:plastocyanin
MRIRLLLTLAIMVFATSAFAKDIFLSIGGSVGVFHTDTRIFNPSSSKDIQIQAYLLPLGKDSNNSNVQPKTITVPKRSMVEYDDVVSSLFGATGLGGIRFNSSDDFVATQRVYSTAADGGTNGQFVAGVDSANALMKGVITQMKSNPAGFRTNRGIVNPNSVPANVTWQVYGRNNNPAGPPITETLAPFAVVGPTTVSVPSADLTDMWLSFSSDQPVIAYGSVIDNLNSAGTYVAAAADDATPLTSPRDIYLSIGGSVGTFRTDTRIFNPSSTKDIQIQAFLLPLGNANNSGVQPKTITVPRRSMAVYDDVVSSLFGATGLGGIRLMSSDNFIATQRVYSTAADGSTNGQFVAGVDATTAMKTGVVIQMKVNGSQGQARTFRTNVGVVNPNPAPANVTWRIYDKSNNLVGQPFNQTLQPLGVIGPSAMAAFGLTSSAADLSDTWITFSSDQPILAYGSVIDNLNSAGTYVAAAPDSGGTAFSQPTTPQGKVFNVTEQSFRITISPTIGQNDLKPGDVVTFHITVKDSDHGLELLDPVGTQLIPFVIFNNGDVVDKTFTITQNGTYSYFCVNTNCGTGHASMQGEFVVGTDSDGPGPHYKH